MFSDCDFTKMTAPDATLTDCTFRNCRFAQADLSCRKSPAARRRTAISPDADLSGPVIERTAFKQCDLTKTDFIAGEFKEIVLDASVVTRAIFVMRAD
jgi:uncharacterized protein YjbI with pentapeptide repeats